MIQTSPILGVLQFLTHKAIALETLEKESILLAELDLANVKQWREKFPALRDARKEFLNLDF